MNSPHTEQAMQGPDAGEQPVDFTTKLPPFSKAVFGALQSGRCPNVYLFAGTDPFGRDCWQQAQHRLITHGPGTALAMPDGEDPHRYRWPALDSLVVVPGDCPGERFRALMRCLLAAGCRCAVEVRPDPETPDRYLPPICHYARFSVQEAA